ncbi:MAG: hypothetical protein H7259_06360 [Cytophagales bacterium]|nr:hypothetical protein [Cytophaga sp.]
MYSILSWGSTPDMPLEDQISVRLANKLNLATIFIIAIPCILSIIILKNDGQPTLIRFELLILAATLNLYLNKHRYFLTVKILTLLAPVILVIAFPLISNYMYISPGMLLWMPYSIMVIGSFGFALFSYGKQRNLMLAVVLFFAFLSSICDVAFVALSERTLDLAFLELHYFNYKVAHNVICILVYYNLFFLKRINYRTQKQLDEKNEELKNTNELLEVKVAQRTEKLVSKNIKMQELAYTNSHKVRGGIARIEGLAKILKMNGQDTENDFCIEKIIENVDDLNIITKELSKKLYEEENY